ncbi:MAG: hypothetical protein ACJAUG_001152 [Halioglobus sp.]|jgi:hypothetical protein
MIMTSKRYTEGFKIEAVKQVNDRGMGPRQTCIFVHILSGLIRQGRSMCATALFCAQKVSSSKRLSYTFDFEGKLYGTAFSYPLSLLLVLCQQVERTMWPMKVQIA